ncbi:signal peptidase II [Candidatus Woesearchaeota archaeon]|nr:signal peptidase II [Candidatus Woesearchaeota archaeon]
MKNKNYIIFFIVALSVVILDQVSKLLVRSNLAMGERLFSIGFFSIARTENTGAAFSILQNHSVLLIWITVIFLGLVLYYFDTFPEKTGFNVLIGMVFGGALSNMLDRIFLGRITDFLATTFWPTFNMADSCICIGAVGLVVFYFKEDKKK